ncbi:hypothetical protein [Paenibacillus xanthanilyticus]|uniref:Uncharacterized protein n=1 Tax=Paenibacillus xanthanilyticus TaxID=1783531 RepID=A0ABV8K670_9BACL
MLANSVKNDAMRWVWLLLFAALAAVLVAWTFAALQPPAFDDGVEVARRIIVYQTTSAA